MKKVKLGFGFILVAALAMVAGAVIYPTLFDNRDGVQLTNQDARSMIDMDVVSEMLDATRAMYGTYCFSHGRWERFEIEAHYTGSGTWMVNLGACTFPVRDSTGKGEWE